MKEVINLTDNSFQKMKIVNDDGTIISIDLMFLSSQSAWSFNISSDSFFMNGSLLVVSFNMLRQFKNVINYGLRCTSTDGFDPYAIEDFSSGRISIFILNEIERETIEDSLFV